MSKSKTVTIPPFCPYSDCDGSDEIQDGGDFEFLGVNDAETGLVYYCHKCNREFTLIFQNN